MKTSLIIPKRRGGFRRSLEEQPDERMSGFVGKRVATEGRFLKKRTGGSPRDAGEHHDSACRCESRETWNPLQSPIPACFSSFTPEPNTTQHTHE